MDKGRYMGIKGVVAIKKLREPPVGPRSGCEARSEANPVRWRPVAKRRGTP
jgi:hypothetical protein